MKRHLTIPLQLVALLLAVALTSAQELPKPSVNGMRLTAARLTIDVDTSGLPKQIDIAPSPTEIPLPVRADRAQWNDDVLREIGRGPQLLTPVRLMAVIGGKVVEAEVATPAALKAVGATATATAKLKLGGTTITLKTTYGAGGALTVTLADAGGPIVERLWIEVNPVGPIDTVIPGPPTTDRVQAYDPATYALSPDEPTAWESTPDAAPLAHLYVGSGDRGWTWLTTPGKPWDLDPKTASTTLERDQAGNISWRLYLANQPTKPGNLNGLTFALATHPVRMKPVGHRQQAWINWPVPGAAAAPAPTLDTLQNGKPVALLRADVAGTLETLSSHALLVGPAGGAAQSPELDIAQLYPPLLFRYLAGTHTGQVRRLVPNTNTLIRAGEDPAPDRMALGRALVHDIGIDPAGLAHLADTARLVAALHAFGFFEADGQTDYIPYWRSQKLLHFGEQFSSADAFALDAADPLARVHVAIFRRPDGKPDSKQNKVMVVIVNEGETPVRDQLYIDQPKLLFGGPNRLTARDIADAHYDLSRFSPKSDWSASTVKPGGQNSGVSLMDFEDTEFVKQTSAKDGSEVYGPFIHVGARNFRILYATGRSQ